MTERVVTVTYTEKVALKAAMKYFWTMFGGRGLATFVFLAVWSAVMAFLDLSPWLTGPFAGAAAVWLLIMIKTLAQHRTNAVQGVRMMRDRTGTFTFTESGFRAESENGATELPWRLTEKVIQYPDVWLISVRGTYIALPIATVPDETRAFILAHIPQAKSQP
jgi:hypothetical protein